MPESKQEAYHEMHAELEERIAIVAQRKADLSKRIANKQAELDRDKARANQQMQEWDQRIKEANDKLNQLLNGKDAPDEVAKNKSETKNAVGRIT